MSEETESSTAMHEERELGSCAKCGREFTSRIIKAGNKILVQSRFCNQCVEQANEGTSGYPKGTGMTGWEAICPPAYLKTNPDRLKEDNRLKVAFPAKIGCREFIERVISRPFSERGLGFVGDSRIGKTRLMFLHLKPLYNFGKSVSYTFAPYFSDEYAAKMSKSPAAGNVWIENIVKADCWFLDDFGKGRLSESSQRAIFRVVEERTNMERPIFITSNLDGAELENKMRYEDGTPSEYAKPLIARLREFCDFYKFEKREDER